eukprot:CAMPEP_0118923828 /NCGR_PEP_ID=MMETSP1169-20130426/2218_1 /TAXON_ID=36882 /ORGANISM="Pyramimonas obovata, Strain CCMP722" /LENGTH=175 /DNA_ID=CAMNT_0006864879 /DNA_START=86 /DNA_END=613 /DNA_ORIENTATION=+
MAHRSWTWLCILCLLVLSGHARVLQQADLETGAQLEIANTQEEGSGGEVSETPAEAAATSEEAVAPAAEAVAAPDAEATVLPADAPATSVGGGAFQAMSDISSGVTSAIDSFLPSDPRKYGDGNDEYHKKRLSMNAMTDFLVYSALIGASLALPVAACTYVYRICCGPGSRKALD